MEGKTNVSKSNDDSFEEKIKMLSDFYKPIKEVVTENSMQFESKIIYLGAGSIALVLAFADQHPKFGFLPLLIIGISFLCITVCMNLYSAIWFNELSKKHLDGINKIANGVRAKQIDDINDEDYICNKDIIDKDLPAFYKYFYDKTMKRISMGDKFNKYNLWILFAGIVITLLYVILNLK